MRTVLKGILKFEVPQHLQNIVPCLLMKDFFLIFSVSYWASLLYWYIRGISTFNYSVKDI